MANTISNSDAIIDSRDVIARIDELESERGDLADEVNKAQEFLSDLGDLADDTSDAKVIAARDAAHNANEALADWDNGAEGDELKALKALAEEAEDYASDWKHGEALIRDSYFKEYAQQFADDIGAINAEASWPNDCIDWDRAARELQMDYTAVDYDGVTYWVR